jgi:hypothetical protein
MGLYDGRGPQTDKHLSQSPFAGKVFRPLHLALVSIKVIIHTSGPACVLLYPEDPDPTVKSFRIQNDGSELKSSGSTTTLSSLWKS